jgi:hypothetical protein
MDGGRSYLFALLSLSGLGRVAVFLCHFLETLTLAGVLPFTRVLGTLAGRLTLAGIDAVAMNLRFVGYSGGD